MFPPEYESLPDHVVFKYDGQKMKLSPDAEEIAGYYAGMLDVSVLTGIHMYSFFKTDLSTRFMSHVLRYSDNL